VRNNKALRIAFNETLDSFGKENKKAILLHLKENHGIHLDSGPQNLPRMEQLEKALIDMFGILGAGALMRLMDTNLSTLLSLVKP
jgi:hypothetical protein